MGWDEERSSKVAMCVGGGVVYSICTKTGAHSAAKPHLSPTYVIPRTFDVYFVKAPPTPPPGVRPEGNK
jgi:hypothetical protein